MAAISSSKHNSSQIIIYDLKQQIRQHEVAIEELNNIAPSWLRKMNKNLDSESSSEDVLPMEQPDNNPSFFQLYLPENSSETLRIPPPFIKNFDGGIPEKILLKNSDERVWPAKLAYIDNKLHITDGWECYVKDHELKSGEFVMFRYQHNATFFVMVYGPDNLLKPEPPKKLQCRGPGGNGVTDVHFTEARTIKFYKKFMPTFKHLVGLPRAVTKECVITLPHTVKLTNDTGKGIEIALRKAKHRYVLGYSGLGRFWKKNGAQEGDQLEFEVIRGDGDEIKQIIVKNYTRSQVLGRGY